VRLTKHTETGALLFLCATLLVIISQLIVTRIVLLMLHTERDKASPFYFCTNSHVSSAEVNTSDHTLDLLCVSLGSVGGKAGNRLSINDSLNSLFVNISLGAKEILTF